MTKRVVSSSCSWVGISLLALVACKQPDRTKETETAAASVSAEAAAAAASAESAGLAVDKMTLPADFPAMKIPEDNPQTDAKVALGHQLFFDKRLSVDGSRACYSCHMNENGTGGADPIAIGAQEKKLTRHSPMLWNVGHLSRFYWDGRADSLEAQMKGAWGGGNMGVGKENLDAKAKEIGKIPGYKKQFDEVFKGEGATADTVAKAVSAYERTLICNDTAYDKYAKGDKKALDDAQKKGLALFMGKAGCTACHTAPFFSSAYLLPEGTYFNVGTGLEGKAPADVDVGRKAVTEKDADWAAFKVPSLRNVSKTAPYFHNGSKKTLEEAVRFMASGGYKNTNRSPLMVDRQLSDAEIKDLVAFLGALECGGKLEEPKLPE
ncbi:MAG TPA: cytochrome c peroxidase [Polyangiaceae bacterium]